MNTFIPTSVTDLGDSVRFTNATSSSVVSKRDRQLIAEILNNFVTLPPLSAELDGIRKAFEGTFQVKQDVPETQEIEVTIPTEAVLTLNELPAVLVSAPGEGKFIEITGLVVFLDYATTAYLDPSTATFFVSYDNAGNGISSFAAADLLTATSDKVQTVAVLNPPNTISAVDNKSVVLSLDYAVTTGNSPLRVKATYRVRSIA